MELNEGRVCFIVLIAVVDPPGVVTQLRVEQRDFQYRLVTQAKNSPLTGGGHDVALNSSLALWRGLVDDQLAQLRIPTES